MGASILATGSSNGSQACDFVKVELPGVGAVGQGERHVLGFALVGIQVGALFLAALGNPLVGDGVHTGFESLR